ncbi:hybrid sensor histidine kinase/response regulator [Clostridium sp. FP1]|uniref:hybrid sensor histidine kinase/response regulator n=1 Tax=Clostridium sp. FP1 TaxID=2724076 RepID=UPI0013E94552|nr:hybrid sensor histidine kinase/response regulator [Clostridium sp. FP1]MBZ9634323.1 response regulator [Clostridium sp. FP1]
MKRVFSLKCQMLLNNLLIFILPALIFGYFSISLSTHRIVKNIQHENSIMAYNINNQVENFIQNPINIMNALKKDLLLENFVNDTEIDKYLSTIINIYPYFDNIRIVNKDGMVKNTAPFNKDKIGTSTLNEDFFKKIDKSGKPVWSRVFISEQTQSPTVSISFYVNGDLLVADLNLSKIIKITQGSTSNSVESVSILDEKGTYLVDTNNNNNNVIQRRQFDYFNEIKDGIEHKIATINIENSNNNKLILYSTKIELTGWYSVIVLDSNKALGQITQIKTNYYIAFFIMILLYLILSTMSVVSITKAFNNLISKIKLISAGDYSMSPKTKDYKEFIQLSNYFDIMKKNIRLRENEIQSLNVELEDRVVDRTKQLAETNCELEESNATLEDTNCELKKSNAMLEEQISERQRAETEIKKLNEELEDRVLMRTIELQIMNSELEEINVQLKAEVFERIKIQEQLIKSKLDAEQANIAKSQFLANMSHEIRTPMNGIMGMTQLALMTDLDEAPRQYLTLVIKSTKVLLTIINDVLDLSKIEAGKIAIEAKPFKIRDVVSEVITLFDISANEKGIILKVEIDKTIPDILNGDAVRLRQVLSNIIGNAVKFTQMGNVTVSVLTDHMDENFIKVKFSIEDTGIGIPIDKQGLLFERFKQLDSTYTKQYQGTGLGLAISKNLVRLMGGDIWLESEEMVGSTFHFTINLQKIEAILSENPLMWNNSITDNNFNKTVLLVEDDKINRRITEIILKKKQFNVLLAENGKDAIDLYNKFTFNLIIMDINMPVMDGHTATLLIREKELLSGKHTPIIAMTAYALSGDKDKFISAGMDDYISKPVNFNDLSSKIDKWVNT